MQIVHPKSVVDVGCGSATWTKVFADHGCRVTGIDGDYVPRDQLEIPLENFRAVDIETEYVRTQETYDLAVSLEVAEHLAPGRAESFVEDLCGLSDCVLFSAAVPKQGGVGHVNEKWTNPYWTDKFEANGFDVSGALRFEFLSNPAVEPWYAQNLMLAAKRGSDIRKALYDQFNSPVTEFFNFVHPVTWEHRVK